METQKRGETRSFNTGVCTLITGSHFLEELEIGLISICTLHSKLPRICVLTMHLLIALLITWKLLGIIVPQNVSASCFTWPVKPSRECRLANWGIWGDEL